MSEIKRVVLAGAGGNIGSSILKALHNTGYTVTILSREASSKTFPSFATVIKSDFSPESLLEVFRGQDAVVSAVASTAAAEQRKMIDAAAQAGVKRFLPSEFGTDTANAETIKAFKALSWKVDASEYLKQTSATNPGFTWSRVIVGPFFDWSIKFGYLGYDLSSYTATIFDEGDHRFSTTNLATIGSAVASVLAHTTETANKCVYVSSFDTTQNEILSSLEKATHKTWTIERWTAKEAVSTGAGKLANGDGSGFKDLSLGVVYGDGYGTNFEKDTAEGLSNTVLKLPKEDLDVVISEIVEGKRP